MRPADIESYALSLLRIITGFLFFPHGFQKLFGMFGGGGGVVFPAQLWWAGILEGFGGLLILLGLFTRPVAFMLSGLMAVAYFQQHAPQGFWPIANRGELAALYCFVYLFFCIAGPGPISLDAAFRNKRRKGARP